MIERAKNFDYFEKAYLGKKILKSLFQFRLDI
jgi:hypothetical protein